MSSPRSTPMPVQRMVAFFALNMLPSRALGGAAHAPFSPVVSVVAVMPDFLPVIGHAPASYDLDGPLPDLPVSDQGRSRAERRTALARREDLTIRRTALRVAAGRGHHMIVGIAADVADRVQARFETGARPTASPSCRPSSPTASATSCAKSCGCRRRGACSGRRMRPGRTPRPGVAPGLLRIGDTVPVAARAPGTRSASGRSPAHECR
jgi:hypothetical protein